MRSHFPLFSAFSRNTFWLFAAATTTLACGGGNCGLHGKVQTAPDAGVATGALLPPAPASDPRADGLWAALEGGDDADFARLGDYLPVVDMVQAKATRDHALVHRAMGFTPGWEAFPPLVSAVVAEDARDGALDGLLRLSSRERRAGEIDAPEALFAAADELAAWVGKGSGSKKDRARAVTVLRRLNVWGWVPKAELSKADDAK